MPGGYTYKNVMGTASKLAWFAASASCPTSPRYPITVKAAAALATARHPLHLVEADLLASSVAELRRARAGMVRHLRRLLQRPAVFQIRGDPGRPETN